MTFKNDYTRVAVAVPTLEVGNPDYNIKEIKSAVDKAVKENVNVIVFPELSITGYTCADLFNQNLLIKESEKALRKLLTQTENYKIVIAVGAPVKADNQLFNCAVIIQSGTILGIIPKTFLPNYSEFYEKRWFQPSISRISNTVDICGETVPFGENLLFKDQNSDLCIGVEICEDLWVNIPPSSYHTLNGANLILNLSASNETIAKPEYRKDIVRIQSAKCITGYAYASAGQSESTTDVVFSGHSMIASNGSILEEMRFTTETCIEYADVDISSIMSDRIKFNSYMGRIEEKKYQIIYLYPLGRNNKKEKLKIKVNPQPFVPSNKKERDNRCQEIVNLQATGLYQRLRKIGVQKAVIGISGGLDSTLALLATVEAFKKLNLPMENIIGITMPGFGTTKRTLQNSLKLMTEIGITQREISIKDACIQHYNDIGHDINIQDVTYENVQARERTQILMDVANKEGGLVVGTGDLSELALGWCTYNGDHMSMYAVNTGVPKTLVRFLVQWYGETSEDENIRNTLLDICDTPVSPELLPPDKDGNIKQVTEESIGSYDLNDFFLYHMVRNGFEPKKIFLLASIAFKDVFTEDVILETLKNFYRRFFTQQFKRSCLPDGTKIGSICLSPRGDFRMPSDACYKLWTTQLENI